MKTFSTLRFRANSPEATQLLAGALAERRVGDEALPLLQLEDALLDGVLDDKATVKIRDQSQSRHEHQTSERATDWTSTGFVWPMRWTRSRAWSSVAVFL